MTHGIVEWLIKNAQVQQQVGLNKEGDTHKVFAVVVSQEERPPYVCCRVTSVQPAQCKGEAALEETDTIQVDCYHNSYQDTYILYRVIRSVLDGMSFEASDGTKLSARLTDARDATEKEMNELGRRNTWGILSFYTVEVSLGDIT